MEKLVQQALKQLPSLAPSEWPQNWPLKLFSLLFAIFLWYFVVGEDKVEMNLTVPVEIVNLPHNLIISNQYKKEIEVTVSGSRGLIHGINKERLSRTVDLKDAQPGSLVIKNTAEDLSLPRGVRILRVQPTHNIFVLDQLIQKDLRLTPSITGKVPAGYTLTTVLEPATITLTGPKSILGERNILTTEEINVDNLTASTVRQVPLKLTPEMEELLGESTVTARLTVKEKIVSRTLSQLPLVIKNTDPTLGYLPEPETVAVTLSLPYSKLPKDQDWQPLITLTIDAAGLGPGRHTLVVQRTVAEGISISKLEPARIQLDVSPILAPKYIKIRRQ